MIRVVEPGLLTTVQDRGRWGHQSLGVSVAGPMDDASHQLANLLVGNAPECATLEVTLAGPTLEFLVDTLFVVAGAAFELRLDDASVPIGVPCRAGRGSVLRFGRRGAGARAYVGVAGGIDVPPVLGSRSTDLAGGFGGLGGRRLCRGDQLAVGPRPGRPAYRGAPVVPLPLPNGGATVRVMAGPDLDSGAPVIRVTTADHADPADSARCPSAALELFTRARFTLAPESNRMGYRLVGPAVVVADATPMLSTPTPFGTVQVPPSGHPIVLMADRQTTGGYAKIATVISADLPLAGQLGPGDWMQFELCDRRTAVAALIALQQALLRVA